jgi:hypothetical protein
MICRSRKLIFIHIPKTGGSSIEDMLWPEPRAESDLWKGIVTPGHNKYQSGGLQHLTAQLIRHDVGEDMFAACYRFALVRDPVDRLVSQFNYLNHGRLAHRLLGLGPERCFDDYLDAISVKEHVQWKPQVDFLLDDDGTQLAEIYKLEDMAYNFDVLAAKIGIVTNEMLHVNVTVPPIPPDHWVTLHRRDLNNDQLRRIQMQYCADFELLDYPTPVEDD